MIPNLMRTPKKKTRTERHVTIYCSSSSSDTSAGQRFPPHNRTLGVGEFRVGGGVHDSYTFQCGLVGSFTSPGIQGSKLTLAPSPEASGNRGG